MAIFLQLRIFWSPFSFKLRRTLSRQFPHLRFPPRSRSKFDNRYITTRCPNSIMSRIDLITKKTTIGLRFYFAGCLLFDKLKIPQKSVIAKINLKSHPISPHPDDGAETARVVVNRKSNMKPQSRPNMGEAGSLPQQKGVRGKGSKEKGGRQAAFCRDNRRRRHPVLRLPSCLELLPRITRGGGGSMLANRDIQRSSSVRSSLIL